MHRTVVAYKTATNTDVLSGTQLETMPWGGQLRVWASEAVATATISITASNGQVGAKADYVPLTDSNGSPKCSDNIPWVVQVSKGDKVKVELGGTVSKCFVVAQLV